jgi:hypothetical protein
MRSNEERNPEHYLKCLIDNARNTERILSQQDRLDGLFQCLESVKKRCDHRFQWSITFTVSLLVLVCLIVTAIKVI